MAVDRREVSEADVAGDRGPAELRERELGAPPA